MIAVLKAFLSKNTLNLLSLLLISGLGIYLTQHLDNYLDVTFYDEANYMIRGRRFWHIYIEPENGPLYSFWYWLLAHIKTDNIGLYYFNWQITTILPALLLFILLKSVKINTTISFCLAIFYMFADLNFITWPRVSNFCICIITLGLIASSLRKSLIEKFLILALAALISSFIRPEFFISYILFILLSFAEIIHRKFAFNKNVYIGGAFILLLTILIKVTYGLPMFEQDASRSVCAFGQYFTINKFISLNIWPEDPWTHWEKHFYEVFGRANSLSEIIKNNPAAFLNQCNINCKGLINKLYLIFLPEFLSPKRFLPIKIVFGMFFLFSTILLFLSYYINKQKVRDFISHLSKHKIQMLSAIVFMIPTLISCIILFPREHYIYLMIIPLIYIGCIIYNVRFYFIKTPIAEYIIFSMVVIILLMNVPSINTYFKESPSLVNLKTVKFIRGLNIKKEIILLENEGGIDVFLSENYHVIIGWAKKDPFNNFFKQYNFNMVWVTDNLVYDARYNEDKEWNYFIANYRQWNFKRVDIPDGKGYLLVKI